MQNMTEFEKDPFCKFCALTTPDVSSLLILDNRACYPVQHRSRLRAARGSPHRVFAGSIYNNQGHRPSHARRHSCCGRVTPCTDSIFQCAPSTIVPTLTQRWFNLCGALQPIANRRRSFLLWLATININLWRTGREGCPQASGQSAHCQPRNCVVYTGYHAL